MAAFDSTLIARLATGLYNVQVGNALMQEALNSVNGNAYGSVAALADALYSRDFGAWANADVAALIVDNVGISGAAEVAEATAIVTGALDGAAAGSKGSTVLNLLNAFSNLNAATYTGYVTAFNTQISAAVAYGQTPGTPTVSLDAEPSTEHMVFTLVAGTAAGADVMHLMGDQDVRIDFTNPANQVVGLDLDGDGTIEFNGSERSITGVAANFEIVDAYSRNPLDHTDTANNFLGDIYFDGTGFAGDGTDTDGNIFLGGLGNDTALGGIGNDFMAGGGVAQGHLNDADDDDGDGIVPETEHDALYGGRNADFFFGEFSMLDIVDGNGVFTLYVDGGNTSDDQPAGRVQSDQDSDWFLLEGSDDDEPVFVALNEGESGDGTDVDVATRTGQVMDLDDVENLDASGNLYGFIDDLTDGAGNQLRIGGRATDLRYADGALQGSTNYGIGSSAQIEVEGSDVGNIIVAGFDNDYVDGNEGNDLIFGGNLQFLLETVAGGVTNVNLAGITLDGEDNLHGGAGNDGLVFEADGGVIDGGDGGVIHAGDDTAQGDDATGTDTLWLTNYSLGTATAADATTDGVLRFDLEGQNDLVDHDSDAEPGMAGYGGADAAGTADQTNYSGDTDNSRVEIDGIDIVDASGLSSGVRGLDYFSAGTNDPDLGFSNRQNFWGYDGDLNLRGSAGANGLYAGAGDDVLEGRNGADTLMGGAGDDDFYFAFDGDNGMDGTDVVRRKVDADGDGFWDGSSATATAGTWGQDFGLDATVDDNASFLVVDFGATNFSDPNVLLTSFSLKIDGVVFAVSDTDSLDVADAEELAAVVNEAYQAIDPDVTVTAEGNTLIVTDAQGRNISDTVPEGYLVSFAFGNAGAESFAEFTEEAPTVTQDRIIIKAYEDRSDNEGVDDDSITGSTISLGEDAYAEDAVVSFGADGTRIAEDQSYTITFRNLTTEDTVTVKVNGVEYTLTVGIALNGTQIDGEDTVETALEDIQTNFLARLAGFINSFMDDDTAAGQVAAGSSATTLTLTQVAYDGEETVFMSTPTVTLVNGSGGEKATATVANNAQTEIFLYQFDGRDGNLNEDNVLFWGQESINRANLETAINTGANGVNALMGTEALVIDGGHGPGDDDIAGITQNLATDQDFNADSQFQEENFAVHGDDLLIGGLGDDEIWGLTGDDRIRGSEGNDELDGGKDWYAVLYEGDDEYTLEYMNAYEATQADADGDVLDIKLIWQTEDGVNLDVPYDLSDDEYEAYFRDTLIYHQADFTAGVTRFTITLNDYLGTGEDIVFDNGGAGTVGVDKDGNGTVEADNVSTFTNFENIRTVSGVGKAVAGTNGGQGRDTLVVTQLSTDADVGVQYDMTGGGGDVSLLEDLDNDDDEIVDNVRQVVKVDGVENVVFGDGDDVLLIDETEAAKDNEITGDDGDDHVMYSNDFLNEDNEGDDEPTITINVGPAHTAGSNASRDTVVSTEGRVGAVIATDTLLGVEEITLGGNTADGIREDDVLNVEALSGGATVNYINGRIYSDTDGDLDFDDGVLQLTVNNLYQIENVVADGADNVVVADAATMSQNGREDEDRGDNPEDLTIDTFLNYDLLDLRGADPARLSVSQLRAIDGGTANTADENDIPESYNFAQFTFSLGEASDTVDYSNANDDIAVVVDFNTTDDRQYVLVDGDGGAGFGNLDGGGEDRVDVLNDVENVVASQGESIIDLTNSNVALAVTFSRQITTVGEKDVHRVQLSNLDTDATVGKNYLEFRANGTDDDYTVQAVWNTVEGSDHDEKVELTDAETEYDHAFHLRGGTNEVNYNELTRSIELSLDVVDYDEDDPANTGLIEGTVTFFDGSGNQAGDIIGGTDEISSYSAQNGIATGTLRVEASQDAEDVIGFAAGLDDKIFILGEVISGSDQITVTIGSADAANSIELTGFEYLRDSAENDVYTMADLERVQDNLVLLDSATNDRDTIVVFDDAVAYDGGPAALTAAADTISLEVLNDVFGFDFDVLDITGVEESDLLLVGDDDDQDNDATLNAADNDYIGPGDTDEDGANDTAREISNDDVIVGDLGLIDGVSAFNGIWFTAASVAGEDTFVLDTTNDVLEDGSDDTLFTTDDSLFQLNFSLVGDVDLDVTIVGNTGITLAGGAGDDTLTGGGGDDIITGGAGADALDGGTSAEVQSIDLSGQLAADGNFAGFDWLGLGNLTLDEAAVADADYSDGAGAVVDGAGTSVVGAQLAALLNANLVQANLDWQTAFAAADEVLTGVSFSGGVLTFTFAAGFDVANDVDVGFAAGGDTGTFAVSATSTVEEGSDGGADVFDYVSASEGGDSITGFVTGVDDIGFRSNDPFVGTALGDLIDDNDNAAIAFVSATDNNATAAQAAGADPEALFIDSANNGTFTVAALSNLTTVAALFEANFSGPGTSAANDALLVLESDTEGTFGVYWWDSSDTDGVIEASELTLIAIVEGDDVATGDFVLGAPQP